MYKTGKTLTIFVVLITILLVSSTAIGFFMYQKESQIRKDLEGKLQDSITLQKKVADDLKTAQDQLKLLQDKNKEADKKINNLMDEIELNNGLHTALKKENSSLKESLDYVKKEKETIRAELDAAAKKLSENQEMLKAEQTKTRDLLAKVKDFEDIQAKAQEEAKVQEDAKIQASVSVSQPLDREAAPSKNKMELGKIVVSDHPENKGHIISVDKESEFVICSLGTNQGINNGDVLSVYRGDRYLGSLKVSRAQDQMSAADFVLPLSSRKVRKNDIVVLKQS